MAKGKVKFFDEKKGFGFITDDQSKKDVFVHHSNLENKVKQGDRVLYETDKGKKGIIAIKVILE